jgi:phosphate transport system protein
MGDSQHTVDEYEKQLDELRGRLLGMAGRVEEMIHQAVEALVEGDAQLAEKTLEDDRVVNHDEMTIDDLCLRILAKRQPMAGDLRLVTTVFEMVTDLERIGDLAVNISLEAIDQRDYDDEPPLSEIPELAEIVEWMVTRAIESFIDRDADTARDVIHRDDEVDALYAAINRRMVEYMRSHEEAIEAGTGIQSAAKHLERMADHTTNLGEKVIFMVDGKDVRHRDKLDEEWHEREDRG